MIGADRRGMQAAYEEASKYPRELPVDEVKSIAERVLARMRAAGYAHLDPEQDFIQGFVERFYLPTYLVPQTI